jgi:hypothetical protein
MNFSLSFLAPTRMVGILFDKLLIRHQQSIIIDVIYVALRRHSDKKNKYPTN